MADLPIWQLTELTAPTTDDLLVAVDDPAGTPVTKKLSLANLATALTLQNVVVQVKTVGSGTYTPTSGMKKVLAIAVGAGGGGDAGLATDSAGGGGGGGGTVIRLMTAAQIGASKAYVVGAGGLGRTSGQVSTDGTATTLDGGTLMNAGGGAHGVAGAQAGVLGAIAAGGVGGTAANGDLNIPGQAGGQGIVYSGTAGNGGRGGRSVFGFGGRASPTDTAGQAGTAYGGGGGAGAATTGTDRNGAAGANGILYLIELL